MDTENLNNKKAIDKLRTLVNSIDVGMVITKFNDKDYPYMVPMSKQEIDEEGNIWYLISSTSQTYLNIENNNVSSV